MAPLIERGLAEDVRFRSPFTDYHGRDDVAHLLDLIGGVLDDVRVAERVGENPAISVFEAVVAGEEVQGMLFERLDDAGQVVDAMLTVRPYAGLRAAMGAMGRAMEESPLPSDR